MSAALYIGTVMHRRLVAPRYRFRYRLFQIAVDIDRLKDDLGPLWLLSYNRFNLFSFHDRDHGPKNGSSLRAWIDDVLVRAGLHMPDGNIRLLCLPRVLGYGFNPLSVWYCRDSGGRLRAVLCEVRNTFGEWHGYLLHENGAELPSPLHSRALKCFHVSPFFPVQGEYRFRMRAPDETFSTVIEFRDEAGVRMLAAQQGQRHALTDGRLLTLALTRPLQSVRVMVAIHWQALKLWLRGARFHRKPPPPQREVS